MSYGAYTQMDAINCHKGFDKVNNAWGGINIGLYIPVLDQALSAKTKFAEHRRSRIEFNFRTKR